jgi:hypothetical protein
MHRLKLAGVICAALAASAHTGCFLKSSRAPQPAIQTNPVPDAAAIAAGEKKLDAALLAIARGFSASGGAGAQKAAAAHTVTLEQERAHLQITCASEAVVPTVQKLITEGKGQVEATLENRVYALVPVGQIARLAAADSVWSMSVNRATARPASR